MRLWALSAQKMHHLDTGPNGTHRKENTIHDDVTTQNLCFLYLHINTECRVPLTLVDLSVCSWFYFLKYKQSFI